MAYVTESWADRELARMRGLDRELVEYYRRRFGPAWEEALRFALKYSQKKEHEMAILYDLVDDVGGAHRGSLTACRACGAVVTTTDQEKHDDWHAEQSSGEVKNPPEWGDAGVFEEGTGVSVTCPHCGGMNCTFRDEFVAAGKHRATLPFLCTKCENKFTITFSGSERWTGMVTEST